MNATHKYDILDDYEASSFRSLNEEIKNDPFGLGNTVKGLANMSHKKNLCDFAQELVANYAKYSCDHYELPLHMVPEYELNELVRLYIESTDREVNECIYGNDFSIENDFTCALLAMLQNDCRDTREKFAEITRKNTILYYEKSLQEILDEACNDYLHSMMNEQGYYARQDADNPEIVWSKF